LEIAIMIDRHRFYFAAFALLAGCAARPLAPLTSEHPASPAAAEAPAPLPSMTLTPAGRLPMDDAVSGHAGMAAGHGAHGMSGHTAPPAAASYTCPMHPEVRTTKPGRCPKCGMTLVPQADDHAATGDSHAH
jgi:hypothetical protein